MNAETSLVTDPSARNRQECLGALDRAASLVDELKEMAVEGDAQSFLEACHEAQNALQQALTSALMPVLRT
jgi:prephenate dehydrogenase